VTDDRRPVDGDDATADGRAPDGRRRATATIRTGHADRTLDGERVAPATVAAALAPDNTGEMTTTVVDGTVETTVRRDDAAGLRSTVDDYLVNLTVAVETAQHANRHTTTDT